MATPKGAPTSKAPVKRTAPIPIQVGLGGKLALRLLPVFGKFFLRLASWEVTAACVFLKTLNGTGWSEKTVELWGSSMVPLLGKLGVDVTKPVTSAQELYAQYGAPLRAIGLLTSTVCNIVGFDLKRLLKPTIQEQRALAAIATPPDVATTQASAKGSGGGSGGGGLLLLGAGVAALLLLKKKR